MIHRVFDASCAPLSASGARAHIQASQGLCLLLYVNCRHPRFTTCSYQGLLGSVLAPIRKLQASKVHYMLLSRPPRVRPHSRSQSPGDQLLATYYYLGSIARLQNRCVFIFDWSSNIILLLLLLLKLNRRFHSQPQSNCKLQIYYMSTKTKFNVICCNHMFHSHSILKSTFPTPSTFLS